MMFLLVVLLPLIAFSHLLIPDRLSGQGAAILKNSRHIGYIPGVPAVCIQVVKLQAAAEGVAHIRHIIGADQLRALDGFQLWKIPEPILHAPGRQGILHDHGGDLHRVTVRVP